MGSHFKKLSIEEAEESFTLISEVIRKSLKGGCKDCNQLESTDVSAYSKSEYDLMVADGTWSGGYVSGIGFVLPDNEKLGTNSDGQSGYPPNYCSKHKLYYYSVCALCYEEGMLDYNQGSGYGYANYDEPTFSIYDGNYGGYPNIPGVVNLPDIDLTHTWNFQTLVNGDSFEACRQMMVKQGRNTFGDPYNVYQLKKELNGELVNYGSSSNFHNAIDCINRHLDDGRSIMVGINHTLNYGLNEGTTDQFVLITGRGYDPEKHMYYFIYMDPARTNAADGCNTLDNRFYCNAAMGELYDDSTYLGKRFDVTQVRPNDGKKADELVDSTRI